MHLPVRAGLCKTHCSNRFLDMQIFKISYRNPNIYPFIVIEVFYIGCQRQLVRFRLSLLNTYSGENICLRVSGSDIKSKHENEGASHVIVKFPSAILKIALPVALRGPLILQREG